MKKMLVWLVLASAMFALNAAEKKVVEEEAVQVRPVLEGPAKWMEDVHDSDDIYFDRVTILSVGSDQSAKLFPHVLATLEWLAKNPHERWCLFSEELPLAVFRKDMRTLFNSCIGYMDDVLGVDGLAEKDQSVWLSCYYFLLETHRLKMAGAKKPLYCSEAYYATAYPRLSERLCATMPADFIIDFEATVLKVIADLKSLYQRISLVGRTRNQNAGRSFRNAVTSIMQGHSETVVAAAQDVLVLIG